jgi:hypothetical protein
MKKLFVLLTMASLMLLTGCSGIDPIGKVGDVEFHGMYMSGILTKNHSMVIAHNTKTGKVEPASTGVGTGIISDLIGASGDVGSAYLWGASLEPDEYSDNSSNSLNGGNNTQGQLQGQLQGQHSNSNANANATNKNKNSNKNSNSNSNKNKTSGGGGDVTQNGGGRGGNHNR